MIEFYKWGVKINKRLLLFVFLCLVFSSFMVYAEDPYIQFDPALPSSVCDGEKINVTYKGSAKVSLSTANKVSCVWDGHFDVHYNIQIMEYDLTSKDDEIARADRFGKTYDCETVNLAWPFSTYTLQDVDISKEAGGVEGDTVEVYIEAVNACDGCGINYVSSSTFDVDVLYNCDCIAGPCCNKASRPYKYKPSGAQPIGYTDGYTCSGDNTPIGTNWVYQKDYYCDGSSSSAKSSSSQVDTCGPCEYCTTGDSTCNYYSSSTICGIKDCDYLDTDCRDYHDLNRYCDGAGTCLSPSCNSYTNKPKHTSCGTGKECDGNGNCITCAIHDHYSCYDNDVYWYDKCDNREDKKEDCGEDSCSSSWTYYCDGYDLMKKRWCFERGCRSNKCYTDPWEDTEYIKTCEHGCEEEGPQGAKCRDICYQDSDCGSESRYNPYCGSDGNIYMTYRIPHCGNPGNEKSYCYYTEEDRLVQTCRYGCQNGECIGPGCTDDCNSGNKRCNGKYEQTCGDYDSDVCLEYPTSTSGNGNYDCSDCSCSCGDYNTAEVDNKCNDGKDNDCDGLTDDNDPGCGGVQLDVAWEHTFGESNKEEQGNSVVKAYGGYIVAGYKKSGSTQDSYITKSSTSGSKGWDYNKGYTEANSIQEDGTYTSIIVGSTEDHYAIEKNPYTGKDLFLGGSNIYLAQIGYNGGENWNKIYGSYTSANQDTDEYGYDVVVTSGGSYVITGSSSATGNLWKTKTYGVWADSSGNKQIANGFMIKDGENTGYSIARDGYEFYITGYTTSYQNTLKYIYVLKIYLSSPTSFGERWSYDYGTGTGNSIEVTPDGGAIVAGTKNGNSYLLKVNSNGNKLWDKILDTGEAHSVKIDSNGNYIVTATKDNDIQIYKVSSSGDVLWKKTFDTTNADIGIDIIIDGQQYVVTGRRDNELYIMKTGIPCIAECTSGKTRCNGNYRQICGNYDSDSCLEWPSSTSGSGNDNCADCSCSCGDYNKQESTANGNCNDGKDNDCDSLTDSNDPDCCSDECPIDETRCNGNYKQTCGGYDSDNCLEYPTSTYGSGNDNCADCSCSCGGYNIEEKAANQNCDDGKDNDCDSQIDYGPLCRLYFDIYLKKGWNLISFPLRLNIKSIKDVFNGVDFESIFSHGSWYYYINETNNNFNRIDESKGYLINSLKDQKLTIEGTVFDSMQISLKTGWNLIGYKNLSETEISKLFNNVTVHMYNNSKWYSYDSNKPSQLNTLDKFTPGYGYWIKIE